MKNIKILIAFILFSTALSAQETAPNYLMYRYNMNILNPAYAGVEEDGELNLGFRKESRGLENGDPTAQMFSYSKALKGNLGVGLSVVNREVFINKETSFAVDVSYKVQLNETDNLYFGLKAGGVMYAIDFPSLASNDPIFAEKISTFNPMVGVGAYLKGERYYLNVSSPNLLLSDVQKAFNNGSGSTSEAVTEKLHLYLGGGYRFTVNEKWDFTPSVFSRIVTDEDPLIDVSGVFNYSEKLELGATYRLDTSIIGSLMLKVFGNTSFGFAYESFSSDFSNVGSGTSEFVLRFRF